MRAIDKAENELEEIEIKRRLLEKENAEHKEKLRKLREEERKSKEEAMKGKIIIYWFFLLILMQNDMFSTD